mmetsp:Transcript_8427/g.14901  ORF Transcript_8427/g.14901 Transcript_8427/m.14901 type:complete len:248 (-) Transcript_8427:50-793(-)
MTSTTQITMSGRAARIEGGVAEDGVVDGKAGTTIIGAVAGETGTRGAQGGELHGTMAGVIGATGGMTVGMTGATGGTTVLGEMTGAFGRDPLTGLLALAVGWSDVAEEDLYMGEMTPVTGVREKLKGTEPLGAAQAVVQVIAILAPLSVTLSLNQLFMQRRSTPAMVAVQLEDAQAVARHDVETRMSTPVPGLQILPFGIPFQALRALTVILDQAIQALGMEPPNVASRDGFVGQEKLRKLTPSHFA